MYQLVIDIVYLKYIAVQRHKHILMIMKFFSFFFSKILIHYYFSF